MVKVKLSEFKKTRIEKGFSQRGLAKATGISATMINQIENGTRNPGPEYASILCKVLDVHFDSIFFAEGVCKSEHNTA